MGAQYFAQLDDNNVVIHIAVVQKKFLEANSDRYQGAWIETFFDTAGKTYAGIGMEYLPETQDFRVKQPHLSWAWVNNVWQPPTPKPEGNYYWNEAELEWIELVITKE